MIKYRPHKSSLSESMKNMKTFHNLDEMYNYIITDWSTTNTKLFNKEDLSIGENLGPDDRNEWKETRYVCVKRIGNKTYEQPQCIGICSIE